MFFGLRPPPLSMALSRVAAEGRAGKPMAPIDSPSSVVIFLTALSAGPGRLSSAE